MQEKELYDLAIIGGGPAGVTAGIYAARKKLKTVIITDNWGGQSMVSDDIQNWIGYAHIPGAELAKKLEEHLLEYATDTVHIDYPNKANTVNKDVSGLFTIKTEDDKLYTAKTLLVVTGATRRKLPAQNAEDFEHKGLTYCASCDGPLFSGRDVIVIGGGNAGFETAAQLLAYAKSVTLFEYGDKFAADEVTVEKLKKNENFKALTNAQVTEVLGENFVDAVKYKDTKTGEEHMLETGGIFVEIGMVPNTGLVKDIIELDPYNRIIVDHQTQKTSTEGAWAAGDCTDNIYHQNSIAMGDAVKALEDIYAYLKT